MLAQLELGAVESGIAASLLGTAPAIWAGGLVTLAVVGLTALVALQLRRLDLNEMARAQMSDIAE